jgi:hypothetical protein
VDRLLASPRYGERMAMRWLDAARYADTNGYQTDAERSMWRWRDWVIDAFNRNMPYDRFTVEQIAGDLLPGATRDQRVATWFQSQPSRETEEGGIIPEEYAVEYVVDRVDTTSTVFLGLTLGCARCHNHKFDPLTQKRVLPDVRVFQSGARAGQRVQVRELASRDHARRLRSRKRACGHRAETGGGREAGGVDGAADCRAQRTWEKSVADGPNYDWAPSRALAVDLPFDGGLEGSITRDPPRAEKYLYLMENGPVQQEVTFTGSPSGRRAENTRPVRSDDRWESLTASDIVDAVMSELRLLRFLYTLGMDQSCAWHGHDSQPRARRAGGQGIRPVPQRRTSGRESDPALARRWRPRRERSDSSTQPLVSRDPDV